MVMTRSSPFPWSNIVGSWRLMTTGRYQQLFTSITIGRYAPYEFNLKVNVDMCFPWGRIRF